MKSDFINPFLDAIINILETMAQTTAKPQKPFIKKDAVALGIVTGMIGMAGEQTKGSMAISFSEGAILHVASNMLGETFAEVDDTVVDMVGEITNMVTGGAKRGLSEKGYKFDLAIPTMISGKDHQIHHKTKGPILIVPFDTEAGNFVVEVCFEKEVLM